MAQLDDANQKGNWSPHDSLTHHLATHTPIQVPRQPDGATGAFHTMQHQGPWRLPFGGFAPTQPQSLFRPTWQQPAADWQANNNKVNEWEKWNPTLAGELARPRPQLLSPQFGSQMIMGHAALSAVSPEQVVVEKCEEGKNGETPMDQDDLHSPKEDERKSAEHHSASYDASATPSLSGDDDERRLDVENADNNSEDHIDVEETTTPKAESEEPNTKDSTPILNALHYAGEDMKGDRNEKTMTAGKEEDAPHLLLNFIQHSLTSSSDQAHVSCATPSTEEKSTDNTVSFGHSGTSAFSNPESSQTSVISTTPVSSASGFCRPPGLGPTTFMPPTSGQGTPLVCPICGFSCNSKFHYNSHMNTHGDHQCTMCDYTSRTEGRLKKHMRESHTVEEQLAAGLDIKAPTPPPSSSATATIVTTRPLTTGDTSSLSTTMASLVNVANLAAAAVAAKQEPSNSLVTALSMENVVSSNRFLNTMAPTGLPSALDQIRAFAENSALLPESGVNLANALSVMSQEITEGIERTPEKSANSEPRRNSNGKMKQYKCKQCPHISFSKDDQWAHSRTHIPVDKQMNCPTCNFVTEYKHHLEYHIRNHIGSKPFQCKKCSYTCVNKSMLNSHMKSHTNIYQFRCLNCTYATKYCHSLKLHLKKYGHHRVPDGVEMEETSPTQVQSESAPPYHNFGLNLESSTPATSLAQTLGLGSIITSQSLNYASQILLRQHQMKEMNSLMGLNGLTSIPQPALKCAACDFQTSSQDELIRHNMSHFLNQQTQSPMVNLYQSLPQMSSLIKPVESLPRSDQQVTVDTHEEHDSGHAGDDEMEGSSGSTGSPHCSFKGSGDETDQPARKSKAFKLEQISQRLQGKSPSCSEDGSGIEDKDTDEHHEESSVSPSDPLSQSSVISSVAQPVVTTASQSQAFTSVTSESNLNIFQQAYFAQLNALQAKREDSSYPFQCQHCRVGFQDQALYHIHMGYHGYEHVFKCNRCGHIASDYLNFNLHLLQASHE